MSSKPSLADRPKKELVELARRRGVAGADGLSKEALVKTLSAAAKEAPAAKAKVVNTKAAPTPKPAAKVGVKPAPPVATRPGVPTAPRPGVPAAAKVAGKPMTTSRVEALIPADKDLSTKTAKPGGPPVKDRLTLTSPDPYWLHAFWELTTQSVHRAEAALGSDWHGAKPVIRLYDVTSGDTTSTSENPLRDIVVHGGCTRWYIDVAQPPRSYQTAIGYLTRTGRFFPLTRSNVVVPPKAGVAAEMEDGEPGGGAADGPGGGREVAADRDRRPLKDSPFGSGAVPPTKLKKFHFDIEAELIVYVRTDPAATVTLQNEPVKLGADGRSTIRFSLPDSRQIIPAVATSADGMEEQTIVLAVERNTKRLDPMMHDVYGEQ